MPTYASTIENELLPSARLLKSFGVSDTTLARWLKDERLQFPQPIRINGRRYWRTADVQAFQAKQMEAA